MLLRRSVITSFALLKSLSTILVVLQTCFVERYFEDVRIVRAFLKSLICDGVFLPFLTHSHNHEKAPQLQHNIFYNIFYMQYDMYVLWSTSVVPKLEKQKNWSQLPHSKGKYPLLPGRRRSRRRSQIVVNDTLGDNGDSVLSKYVSVLQRVAFLIPLLII